MDDDFLLKMDRARARQQAARTDATRVAPPVPEEEAQATVTFEEGAGGMVQGVFRFLGDAADDLRTTLTAAGKTAAQGLHSGTAYEPTAEENWSTLNTGANAFDAASFGLGALGAAGARRALAREAFEARAARAGRRAAAEAASEAAQDFSRRPLREQLERYIARGPEGRIEKVRPMAVYSDDAQGAFGDLLRLVREARGADPRVRFVGPQQLSADSGPLLLRLLQRENKKALEEGVMKAGGGKRLRYTASEAPAPQRAKLNGFGRRGKPAGRPARDLRPTYRKMLEAGFFEGQRARARKLIDEMGPEDYLWLGVDKNYGWALPAAAAAWQQRARGKASPPQASPPQASPARAPQPSQRVR